MRGRGDEMQTSNVIAPGARLIIAKYPYRRRYAGTPLRKRLFQARALCISWRYFNVHVSQILHTFRKHNPDPFARHGRADIPKNRSRQRTSARCATRMERAGVITLI
jgi:hypothetical protein